MRRLLAAQPAAAFPQQTSVTGSYDTIILRYFGEQNLAAAKAVMRCESGGNPDAQNWNDAKITGMPSLGLFQINSPTNWAWNDPEANIQRAAQMFASRGWSPWSCSKIVGLT